MSVEQELSRQAASGGLRAMAGKLVEKLVDVSRNSAMRGIASVFVLKCFIIAANFALIVLAARAFDVDQFGVFSILFSATGLFSIVATVGQQLTVMRLWNEHVAARDTATLKGALQFSFGMAMAGSVIVAIGFFGWSSVTHSGLIAAAVALYLIAFSLLQVTNHLVRTAVNVEAGDGVGNLFVVLPALAYLGWSLATGVQASISSVYFASAGGALAALLVHFALIRRKLRALFPDYPAVRPVYDMRAWLPRSLKLTASNGLEATNQYLDVLIIGFLMSPAVAGGYFVTMRLANVFATAADTVHMFSTRHIPELYYHKKYQQLNHLLDIVAAVTLVIVAGGLLVVVPGGKLLLSLFNSAYTDYYAALVLQCVGTAAVAAAGPSGSILMLTGHEGRFLIAIGIAVIVRVTLFLVLIPTFGIMGAVTATAVSFILMALLFRRFSTSLTGLDGSVFRLLKWWQGYVRPAGDVHDVAA